MVTILVLLLLSCSITVTEGSPKKAIFPRDVSLSNYIQLYPDVSRASDALTVCSWIKPYRLTQESPYYYPCWLSYAVPTSDDEIRMTEGSHMGIFGSGYHKSTSEIIPLNEWTHLCQTWDALSSLRALYINGTKVASGTTPFGRKLISKGSLVLGQEQASVGGGFQIEETYAGELFGTHILSVALSKDEVARIYRAGLCFDVTQSVYSGDVEVSWGDIMGADWYGNVAAEPVECDAWDNLRAFVGQEITNEFIDYLKLHDTLSNEVSVSSKHISNTISNESTNELINDSTNHIRDDNDNDIDDDINNDSSQ